jgi:uncharacterized protein YhaN
MKIRGWSIDGFGVFRNWMVRDVGPGLTIVYGPNEAGKTTLLAFIRGVLFGYPDRRTRESRYPPLQGGRHGGRLFLLGSDGEVVVDREVDRRGVQVILTGNWEGNEDDLRSLLGRADRNLFRSVFAITLKELQDFETLTGENVRDRIFSAGISGAGVSARRAIAELEDQSEGRERRLRELASTVSQAQTDLIEARERMRSYPDLMKDEEAWNQERERLDRELANLDSERKRLQKLSDLWPVWVEKLEAEQRLAALPGVESFPTDAEVRLAALSERIVAARASVSELAVQQQADEAERDGHHLDDRLAAVAVEVEALRDHVALHRDRLRKLPEIQTALQQAEETLSEQMRELGPNWDEAKLRSFDRSIPAREGVRQWGERQRAAGQALARATSRFEAAQTAQEDAQAQVARLSDQLQTMEEPLQSDELEERETALRQLRAYLMGLHEKQAEAKAQEVLIRDRTQARKVAGDQRGEPWQPLLAGGLLLTLVLAGVALAITGSWENGLLVLLVLGALTGTITLWLRRNRKALDARISWLDHELSEAEAIRDRHGGAAAELRQRLAAEAATIGLQAEPSWEMVEDASSALGKQRNQRTQWDYRKSALDSANELLANRIEEQRESYRRLQEAKTTAEQTRLDWETWKTEAGLPEALSVDGVLDFFQSVQQARATLTQLNGLRAQSSDLTRWIKGWEEPASRVLDGVSDKGEDLVVKLLELVSRCQADSRARDRFAQLSDAIGRRTPQIEQAREQLRAVEEERTQLFDEAAATDEPDFRARLATFAQRERLKQSTNVAERQLVGELGVGADAKAIRLELATGNVSEWEAQATERAKDIEAIGRQRDIALAEHAKKESERLAIEESADITGRELQWKGLVHDLTEIVRQWQVLALARALIKRTLDDFVRTRQPEVLAHASPIFQAVTCGRYDRILQAENGEDVLVMDRVGGTRGIGDLSQGTAEQLYLCIRLALAAEYAKAGADLPILMDEVLVNFDPARAGAVARALVEHASARQVLVFTCHPETRDLFLGINPSIPIVELQPIDPVAAPTSEAASQESLFEPTTASAVESEDADQVSGDIEGQVLECLKQGSLAISEIVTRTGVDEGRVRRTLNVLRDVGKVDLIGQKRGARWQRVGDSLT